MIDDPRSFSDRLIRCESATPALHKRYRKEITAVFERELNPYSRAVWALWAVFGIGLAGLFGSTAMFTYGDLPVWAIVGFGAGAVFGLAFGTLCGWIAWSGRIHLKSQLSAMAGMSWAVVVVMATLVLVFAPDSLVGVRMIVSVLPFLVMAAVFMLANRTTQAELHMKEKLLEIEYRVAELAERIKQGNT